MKHFSLTRAALDDLRQIARFSERQWGVERRNRYLAQIDATFHALGENPALGTACDDITPGYRKFPQGSHLIFYRTGQSSRIEIVRILHKRMDAAVTSPALETREAIAAYNLDVARHGAFGDTLRYF